MPTFPVDGAAIAAAICWENYMPLFRTAMYAKGVDLWAAPTVDDRDNWQATMRHVALEGRCFVLSACQRLTRANLPDDVHPVQGDDPQRVLIGGGSVIVSPLGEILAGPLATMPARTCSACMSMSGPRPQYRTSRVETNCTDRYR
jgi:nitrilase